MSEREQNEVLRKQLLLERSSFLTQWRDLGEFISPRRPRFDVSDVNKGDRRNQKIIDSTATMALRTLKSGMMSGITSPARPWFRLTTPDPSMAEFGKVKEFLNIVTARMNAVFLKSNLYNALPTLYGDLSTFATSPLFLEEDTRDVIRTSVMPVGSYAIAKDFRGRVNVFTREFRMTVRQIIEQFGEKDERTNKLDWSNFSEHIKNQYDTGQLETWVDVCHIIKPNPDHNQFKFESKHKPFISYYYEKGTSSRGGQYLSSNDEKR